MEDGEAGGGGGVDGAEHQKVYGFQTTVSHQSISLLSPAYSSSAPPINSFYCSFCLCNFLLFPRSSSSCANIYQIGSTDRF